MEKEPQMKPLPLLGPLRKSSELSLRALAKKSGVAHDTINQIERGDRRARPATARKLADALDVAPFVLELSIEEVTSMPIGSEFFERLEEDLPDYDAVEKAFDRVRSFVLEHVYGYRHPEYRLEAAKSGHGVKADIGKTSMSFADHLDSLDFIHEAYSKLNPPQGTPYENQVGYTTEAALLLARASAQLLRYVTSELEDNASTVNKSSRSSQRYLNSLSAAERFSRPLADAWIEGAAATRGFMDVIDKAPRLHGEKALEDESENRGGD